MALTGRAVLLALLGILPVAALPSLWTVLVVVLVLVAVCLADVVLAVPVSSLRLSRSGDSACRLGETADVRLSVGNTGGRRVRGLLRDAWVPSAGASPRVQALDVPAGERRVLTTTLRPTLRHRISVRAEAELEGVTADGVLDGVLASVPVPR